MYLTNSKGERIATKSDVTRFKNDLIKGVIITIVCTDLIIAGILFAMFNNVQ